MAAAVVGYALASAGGARVVRAETAATPFANLRAFSGHGELAFVSRGALWVLDGESETLRRLTGAARRSPESPVFSRDGRWLACGRAATRTETRVGAVAGARGRYAEPTACAPPATTGLVGWSPTADELAVIVDGEGVGLRRATGSAARGGGARIRARRGQAAARAVDVPDAAGPGRKRRLVSKRQRTRRVRCQPSAERFGDREGLPRGRREAHDLVLDRRRQGTPGHLLRVRRQWGDRRSRGRGGRGGGSRSGPCAAVRPATSTTRRWRCSPLPERSLA